MGETSEEDSNLLRSVELPCYLNLALCNLKVKNYHNTLHFADDALRMDDKNLKAWYRKGMAHIYQGDFKEAKLCFKEIKTIDPKNEEVEVAEKIMKQ